VVAKGKRVRAPRVGV